MGYVRRRRQRWTEALARAWVAFEYLPTLDRYSSDGNESAVRALVELRARVAEAGRRARRRSLARLLLHDAHVWVDQWLREWESGESPAPHLIVLSEQMLLHLERIAERLATVVKFEARQACASNWPSEEDGF